MNRLVFIAAAAVAAVAAPRVIPKAPPASPYVYEPGPAQFVAGPRASQPEWSPTGRYIAFRLSAPEAPEKAAPLRVVLWSRRTRRAAVDWTAPWPKADVTGSVWLPGSDTLYLGVTDDRANYEGRTIGTGNTHVIRFDPRKGSATETASVWMGPSSYLTVSPRAPYAVAFSGGENVSSAVVMSAGSASEPIELPVGEYRGYWQWSADGSALSAEFQPYAKSPEDKPASMWVQIDARSATLKLNVPKPAPAAERDPPEPPFGVPEVKESYAGPFGAQPVHPLWLVETGGADPAHFLLHPDGTGAAISPAWNGVFYLADGMLFVRPLVRTPRAEYRERLATEARRAATADARQLGLALRSYALDYDGCYPPPGEGAHDAVSPLLWKDEFWTAHGGFHYSFGGGRMNGADPAATELGYFDVPGGRVIAYADGHAAFAAGG